MMQFPLFLNYSEVSISYTKLQLIGISAKFNETGLPSTDTLKQSPSCRNRWLHQ